MPPGARLRVLPVPRPRPAAVEPKCPGVNRANHQQPGPRPGILREPRLDLGLIRGFDQVQSLLAVADGAARNDEAIIHKPVRESRVLVPGILRPDRTLGVPARGTPERPVSLRTARVHTVFLLLR